MVLAQSKKSIYSLKHFFQITKPHFHCHKKDSWRKKSMCQFSKDSRSQWTSALDWDPSHSAELSKEDKTNDELIRHFEQLAAERMTSRRFELCFLGSLGSRTGICRRGDFLGWKREIASLRFSSQPGRRMNFEPNRIECFSFDIRQFKHQTLTPTLVLQCNVATLNCLS